MYREYDDSSRDHFLRRGRGASFHEFDITIGPVKDLNVLSSLSALQGIRYRVIRSRFDRRFKSLLTRIHPDVHEGFFNEMLDLIIKKN